MTAKTGLAFLGRGAFGIALMAILSGSPAPASAAEPLSIVLDQATLLRLPEKVATIIVGNPLIADVAVQAGGLVVVTGKGYGSTNLIALDRTGNVLMERDLQVRGTDSSVFVYRGIQRESYSCMPTCERRITLGDWPDYFSATAEQIDKRNAQATGAGKPQTK